MTSDTFIAGDWGTTRLRLSLCKERVILDTRSGPGIGALTQPPGETVRSLIGPWLATHGSLPLVLCGMAGSRNGWKEAAYIPCPAGPDALRASLLRFADREVSVAIVPGVSCTNRLGAPDVMRGEETQIAGALALRPSLAEGRHVLCLPGTHTKWVYLENGRIRDFLTAMTGELFALLRDHSMLARAGGGGAGGAANETSADDDGFTHGLAAQDSSTGARLLHELFGARSRQLINGVSRDWALAFISGLLVGADVNGAADLFSAPGDVVLIGDPTLTSLYARALRRRDVQTTSLDGSECSLAGLRSLVANR